MKKIILIGSLLAAGCEPAPVPPDEAIATRTEAAPATSIAEAAKPRLLTTAELASAVGPDCSKPTGSKRKGGTAKAEIYVLSCRNTNLLVSVNMDGSSNYIDCKVANALGTPCDKNWD